MSNKIDWTDVEDLARVILGLGSDAGSDEVEEALFDNFNIAFDDFHAIVEKLAPLAHSDVSPLSDKPRRGFVHDDFYLVKV